MKLNIELTLTEMGDAYVAVTSGECGNNLLIRLNTTGALICKGLMDGCDEKTIVERLMEQYKDADRSAVEASVQKVLKKFSEEGLVDGWKNE